MNRHGLAALLFVAIHAALPGMAVGPALAQVRDIKPGTSINLTSSHGIVIAIDNDKDARQVYLLTAKKPSVAGLAQWEAGYEEIPDPSWCTLHDGRFELDANAVARVALSLAIPDEPQNYNRKWLLAVVVEEEAPPGLGLSLAITCRFLIETQAKTDVDGIGAGPLATVPSAVTVVAAPGAAFTADISLRNNTDLDLNARFRRLSSIYADPFKHQRYLAPDRQELDHESWVVLPSDFVRLEPGKPFGLSLAGTIPADAVPGERREEIVFIQATEPGVEVGGDDIGMRALARNERLTFVRVRYDVIGPAQPQGEQKPIPEPPEPPEPPKQVDPLPDVSPPSDARTNPLNPPKPEAKRNRSPSGKNR
jgi:hypothetical protein